jgi:hypothetical protein
MARVIDYAAASARRRRGARDVMADQIAEALAYFGGEAHRRMILDRLVGARVAGDDPELYRLRLINTFEAHCQDGMDRSDRRFRRPFGRDSHRWALNAAQQAGTVLAESGVSVG